MFFLTAKAVSFIVSHNLKVLTPHAVICVAIVMHIDVIVHKSIQTDVTECYGHMSPQALARWHGDASCIIGPLWVQSTDHWWILLTKGSNMNLL